MIWDLYDKNFKKTGKVVQENNIDDIPDGLYHLTVNVWIINSSNEVLMVKKSLNFDLRYPGYWTSINGNVVSGDDSYSTIKKIILKKIGIKLANTDKIIKLGEDIRKPYHYIYETFIIQKDLNLETIFTDEIYYSKAEWINIEEIKNMISNGEIEFPLIERIEKYILPFLKSKK